jgi:hypothetical protein
MSAAADHLAQLDIAQLAALAAALGWASGVRLYAVVFVVGALIAADVLPFAPPHGLQVLAHPAVLVASFAMLCLEFLADKVPGLDSLWDGIHAFIRIPAGAALAAGVFGADEASMATVSALLGGSLAATAYATKATVRLAANTSPEPLSNWLLSFFEDGWVLVMLWLALQYPVLFALTLLLTLLLSVYLLMLLWRFSRQLLLRLQQRFRPKATRDDALG